MNLAARCGSRVERVRPDVGGFAGKKQFEPVLVERQQAIVVPMLPKP